MLIDGSQPEEVRVDAFGKIQVITNNERITIPNATLLSILNHPDIKFSIITRPGLPKTLGFDGVGDK